jgi:hypothetical protein
MFLTALVLTLLVVLAAGPAGAVTAGGPPPAARHSGVVTSIDPARNALTLQELGPWSGPATKPITLSVKLTPRTTIELARRAPTGPAGGWPGGFVASPLNVADVHPGDFATVAVVRRGRQLVATSVDVVRPSGD